MNKHGQWFREEDFVFEGTAGTRYLWPHDRTIWFTISTGLFPVPVFDLDKTKLSLEENMRLLVSAQRRDNPDESSMHLHVIKIAQAPFFERFGLFADSVKGQAITDFVDIDLVDDDFVRHGQANTDEETQTRKLVFGL